MEWLEELPTACPPKTARTSTNFYYRLVDNIPPNIIDFWSNRKLFPEKVFPNLDECTTRSCSILSSVEECRKKKKYDRLKHKNIICFKLDRDIGVIEKTFGKDHYSWWITKNFDPVIRKFEVIHD
jgi:hypothetical protein